MTSSPLDDEVSRQYERWVYPEPIHDLPGWLVGNWQWFDPSHAHRMLWPDGAYRPDLDILVAGCGTNQAAVLAYTNPGARVLAIDVSTASLDHHRALKDSHGLGNLEVMRWPIEDVGTLERDFDLIVSTGVLHHMADPAAGMAALGACLRPHGVLAVMLYARYGRTGVEMLQAAFRDMGLQQDEASLRQVKAAVAALPPDHPVRTYAAIAADLQSDAGLVDTFLHGRDRSYTVNDCIELCTGAGLVFQDWFLKTPYHAPLASDNEFHVAVAALPPRDQWPIMERINARNACHFFMACRPDRPEHTYRIDFTSDEFPGYVPSLRYRCALGAADISRSDWTAPLDDGQMALLSRMDGRRTIAQIVSDAAGDDVLAAFSRDDLVQYARYLFASLWQLDVLAMGTVPSNPR